MAIAEFYKLSKRKNSTKQPISSGTQFSVDLKSGTSFISPTLLLNNSGKPDYNYVSFEGWYYFISDIISVHNDMWEIHCNVDSLATGKAAILNTHAYVVYDSVSNTEIPDNRIPMKTTKSVQASSVACPFTPDGGCYIVSLTGANGSTGVYKVSESELSDLIDDLQDITDNIFDFQGVTPPTPPSPPASVPPSIEDLLDYMAGWLEYDGNYIKYMIDLAVRPISQFFGSGDIPENIRECKYIPFDVGTTVPQSPVYLGSFITQIQSLGKLNTETVHRSVSVNIPWQVSDYRRRSPYTEVYIYLPYIGMSKLSSENLAGQSSLTVDYTLGMRDGSLIVTVSSGSQVIGQYSGNVAASVPVGVSNINLPKAAQSVLMGAAAVASKAIAPFGMAAMNFADSVTPNFSCIGGLDGVAAIGANQNITCYTVLHDTVVAPNTDLATIGSPTMAPKALSALTGFCQCIDAHVEADLPDTILSEIDSYLNSGFFIE